MAYIQKSYYVEAYRFAGNAASPGWPAGWLKPNHGFSPDEKTVLIDKGNEVIQGKTGDFIVNSKGKFFVCSEEKFNSNFEHV